MSRQEFMDIYLSHLPASKTRREAWEKAEDEHKALTGSSRFNSYLSFSNTRSQMSTEKVRIAMIEPGIKAKATMAEFIKAYIDNMTPTTTYETAYNKAEEWHLNTYGRRRHKTFGSFYAEQTRFRQKTA